MRSYALLALLLAAILAGLPACRRQASQDQKVDYTTQKKSIILQSGQVVATCPPDMVLVPTGPMKFGPPEETGYPADRSDKGETLSIRSFCVDRYEWPNKSGEAPLRNVTWLEAQNHCTKAGKRLCAEQEFEKACRGPVGNRYTYGDGYAATACPSASDTYTSGQFTNCSSSFGVHDMSGGVFEWTAAGPANDEHIRYLRGGSSAGNAELSSRCTYRVPTRSNAPTKDTGFRCCATAKTEDLAK